MTKGKDESRDYALTCMISSGDAPKLLLKIWDGLQAWEAMEDIKHLDAIRGLGDSSGIYSSSVSEKPGTGGWVFQVYMKKEHVGGADRAVTFANVRVFETTMTRQVTDSSIRTCVMGGCLDNFASHQQKDTRIEMLSSDVERLKEQISKLTQESASALQKQTERENEVFAKMVLLQESMRRQILMERDEAHTDDDKDEMGGSEDQEDEEDAKVVANAKKRKAPASTAGNGEGKSGSSSSSSSRSSSSSSSSSSSRCSSSSSRSSSSRTKSTIAASKQAVQQSVIPAMLANNTQVVESGRGLDILLVDREPETKKAKTSSAPPPSQPAAPPPAAARRKGMLDDSSSEDDKKDGENDDVDDARNFI